MTAEKKSNDEAFRKEIEAVIVEDDPDEVLGATIDIAMAAEDPAWATQVLLWLAEHPNADVRGNALIGFAHLADRFGALERSEVEPVLRGGLVDPKVHVRGQAQAALDELAESLGWPDSDE